MEIQEKPLESYIFKNWCLNYLQDQDARTFTYSGFKVKIR